jgi:glycine/D-amino acid oxidase-like deaminating enzyme
MDDAPASATLTATLEPREPRQDGPLKKLGRFAGHFLEAVLGGGDLSPDSDLVVRRRGTREIVLRTPADVGSPDWILDEARKDLATLTEDEFLEEWSAPRPSAD